MTTISRIDLDHENKIIVVWRNKNPRCYKFTDNRYCAVMNYAGFFDYDESPRFDCFSLLAYDPYSDNAYEQYKKEIKESFDFEAIAAECEQNKELDYDDQLTGLSFLGTVFSLMPSGKYYTAWATNQTEEEESEDTRYYDALESVFADYGMFITSGDDPCDLFAGMTFDNEGDDNE